MTNNNEKNQTMNFRLCILPLNEYDTVINIDCSCCRYKLQQLHAVSTKIIKYVEFSFTASVTPTVNASGLYCPYSNKTWRWYFQRSLITEAVETESEIYIKSTPPRPFLSWLICRTKVNKLLYYILCVGSWGPRPLSTYGIHINF